MTTKIFVGNLSWHTDERTLKNVFASAGPVKFVKVVRDRATSVSKGFAFVTFKEAEAVPVAVEQFDKFVVDGKPIQVTAAEDKDKDKERAKKADGESEPQTTAAADTSGEQQEKAAADIEGEQKAKPQAAAEAATPPKQTEDPN